MWIISEQPAGNITQTVNEHVMWINLDNLETELNCCERNIQCGLFLKETYLHQS